MGKHRPDGTHAVTPHLVIDGAKAAIEFYREGLGAEVEHVMEAPDGRVMHAQIRIGDSPVFLTDEWPEYGKKRSPTSLGHCSATMHVYVPDVDAAVRRAADAGAEVVMEPADMFWGDRYGTVCDKWGQHWSFATMQKEMTAEEIEKAAAEWFANC